MKWRPLSSNTIAWAVDTSGLDSATSQVSRWPTRTVRPSIGIGPSRPCTCSTAAGGRIAAASGPRAWGSENLNWNAPTPIVSEWRRPASLTWRPLTIVPVRLARSRM